MSHILYYYLDFPGFGLQKEHCSPKNNMGTQKSATIFY